MSNGPGISLLLPATPASRLLRKCGGPVLVFVLLCFASSGCSSSSGAAKSPAATPPTQTLADLSSDINAKIQALPPRGGIVDMRSVSGAYQLASQIVIDRSVSLLLGAVTLQCSAAIAGPCIRILSSSQLLMMPSTMPMVPGVPSADVGTRIVAGPGFSGFLISVEGQGAWNIAFGTRIQGGTLDGNLQSGSGVHIENQVGVAVRDLTIVNVKYGIQIENTNGLFTEGTAFHNIWISDPQIAGISMKVGSGGATSVANAHWGSIYINLFTSGSIGIETDAAALFANSLVDYLKIWMASGAEGSQCAGSAPINVVGVKFRANASGTVFTNTNVEGLSCPGSTLVAVSAPGVLRPVFEHLTVQGAPMPIVDWGANWKTGAPGIVVYDDAK
jgi:hypothetical protein